MVPIRDPLVHQLRRHRPHFQSEKIFDLTGEDDHRDSGGESGDDRIGNELDQRAHPSKPENDENKAGDDGADHQAVVSEPGDDAVDDDHERAGRPADLHTAAAEGGDQETGDDGRVEAALGRHTGGDREGERQWKRHHADHDAGDEIAQHLLARVAFAETDDRFGDEQLVLFHHRGDRGDEDLRPLRSLCGDQRT